MLSTFRRVQCSGFQTYASNASKTLFKFNSTRSILNSSATRSLSIPPVPPPGYKPQDSKPVEWNNGHVPPDGYMTIPPPPPIKRTNETEATMRKRLLYQVRKRGILENDLLLSTFAEVYFPSMTLKELNTFDRLLDENDWDIYYWITGAREVPHAHKSDLMNTLIEYSKNGRKESIRMPNLTEKHV